MRPSSLHKRHTNTTKNQSSSLPLSSSTTISTRTISLSHVTPSFVRQQILQYLHSIHHTAIVIGSLLLLSRLVYFTPQSLVLDLPFDSITAHENINISSSATTPTPTPIHNIPRIIHQSYKTAPPRLPLKWKNTPTVWQARSTNFTYKFWTDEDNRNLIATHYSWFLPIYDSYPHPIQRADAARYFAVLHYGGIYADLDILPVRDVEPLLRRMETAAADVDGSKTSKMLCVAETYLMGLINALFIAERNNTLLYEFTHEELPRWHAPWGGMLYRLLPSMGILFSTGPTRLWSFLNDERRRDKVWRLEPVAWGECHPCRKIVVESEDTFFMSVQGGSWYNWDTLFLNHCFCRPQFAVWLTLLLLVVMLFFAVRCCFGYERIMTAGVGMARCRFLGLFLWKYPNLNDILAYFVITVLLCM